MLGGGGGNLRDSFFPFESDPGGGGRFNADYHMIPGDYREEGDLSIGEFREGENDTCVDITNVQKKGGRQLTENRKGCEELKKTK